MKQAADEATQTLELDLPKPKPRQELAQDHSRNGPFLLGRFLLFAIFFHDAFLLVTQWQDHMAYLRPRFSEAVAGWILGTSIFISLVSPVVILSGRHTGSASCALFAYSVLQALGYTMRSQRNLALPALVSEYVRHIASDRAPSTKRFHASCHRVLEMLILFLFPFRRANLSWTRIGLAVCGLAVLYAIIVRQQRTASVLLATFAALSLVLRGWHDAAIMHDCFEASTLVGALLLQMDMAEKMIVGN